MIQPDGMTTYLGLDEACDDMRAHGWTIHTIPSECGRYAWDMIATHPTNPASPMILTVNVQRSPHLYWWASSIEYTGPEMWRLGTGGTMKGKPLRNELRRIHRRTP